MDDKTKTEGYQTLVKCIYDKKKHHLYGTVLNFLRSYKIELPYYFRNFYKKNNKMLRTEKVINLKMCCH